ncbi:hypothetical protein JL107_17570 [Nakamurella flavida]|uniref:Uncharacterized protein n=1 Tax=Nakamurella flavida TaxID=363630 RepID=A0A939C414_9ACTN|nr:hypothetical protein [Nakamurella flavida]MBM9478260.1 hypothetical protein [Nakamurella flavida]MDP9777569.1 hypothetical protein [Nakamurella flavida]
MSIDLLPRRADHHPSTTGGRASRPVTHVVDLPPVSAEHRLAGSRFTPFHRLIVTGLVVNVVTAIVLALSAPTAAQLLAATITAASVNMCMAVLIRHQYVVNALFALATRAPLSWPPRVRAALAKVYQVGGGVHVGCAISATAWFSAFTLVLLTHPEIGSAAGVRDMLVGVAVAIAADLILVALCARPSMREQHHHVFEFTHRYGGWLALTLFVPLTFLVAIDNGGNVLDAVLGSPNTWILATLIVGAAIPWLQLRRVPVEVTRPSDHVALVRFPTEPRPRTGSASRVSRTPLGEWHAFANMVDPGEPGFRMAISKAGEWTSELIADPPEHLWLRGVPTTGVGTCARLFTKVVWVTTGSGIAPCLPHLLNDPTPTKLVWVTRHPERTYGAELVGQILSTQPDATLWNSDELGKPDLAELAYQAYVESGAEAVICISNKAATTDLVRRLQQRGIPAFGPIWDS